MDRKMIIQMIFALSREERAGLGIYPLPEEECIAMSACLIKAWQKPRRQLYDLL